MENTLIRHCGLTPQSPCEEIPRLFRHAQQPARYDDKQSFQFSLETISEAVKQFAPLTATHCVIAFYGAMGAGKTTFIKALCKALGVQDTVNSPTFSIVNEYTDGEGNPVYHFDCYRINSLREAADFGCTDYLDSGSLCLIEWAEHIAELLPEDCLSVYIEETEEGTRRLTAKS